VKKIAAPSLEATYLTLRVPLAGKLSTFAVAQVEDEVITAQDLMDAISNAHASRTEDPTARRKDFNPILDRLIAGRLVMFEAREMGLDQQPQHLKDVETFKADLLGEHLKRNVVATAKVNPAELESAVQDATREWRLRSLHFNRADDAARVAELMNAGKSFEDAAAALLAEGKAAGGEESKFLAAKDVLPQVLAALAGLKPGDVSPPLKLARGFGVVKVLDVRYADDPKARAEAEKTVLQRQQRAELAKYYDALVKREVKIDWKLVNKIDFESPKPGVEALSKDRRALARFKAGKPITVADLTETLKKQFFHGVAEAASKKSVNSQRSKVLDVLVSKRVVPAEARRLGLGETPEYKKALSEYADSLLFSTYIEKVIAPDVKITDADLQKHYDEHKREYTYPAFFKLEGIAFVGVKQAQAALDKLRSGTDLKWLKTNADGQVKGDSLLNLDGNTVTAASLPRELATALAGAKRGDHRLYASAQGPAYVVSVLEAIEPAEQPLSEVREAIRETVTAEHLGSAIQEHVLKLRKARDVKVFLTRIGE